MAKISCLEEAQKFYAQYKYCDHGHVRFDNGKELEFGFVMPKSEELLDKDFIELVEEMARDWADEKEAEIVELYLSR